MRAVEMACRRARSGSTGVHVVERRGSEADTRLQSCLANTIKSTEEAEKAYGAPVLGHISAEKFEKGEARRLTCKP